MDYARKIGKSAEPKAWKKPPTPPATVYDTSITEKEFIEEDRRLVNWKKWLEDRRRQYRLIKSKTGRDQNDQVLNSCEKVRPLIEMRNLMDYATTPVPLIPDKYRGGPEFWKTPPKLSNRNNPCLPDVSVTPSKKELNVAPELTYVDLPELIEKEKDLTGLKTKVAFWQRSRYLTTRQKELAKQIELISPVKPKTKDLVIRGYIPRGKQKVQRIPPITITSPSDEENEEQKDVEQCIILKIQDREIIWDKSPSDKKNGNIPSYTWSIIFDGEIHRRTEKTIVFENKGNGVIVYEWRPLTFECKFMHFDRRISPFFFNKTKGFILPGQFVQLHVWYLPRIPGVSSESWKLITDPQLCPSPLIFRFWGCVMTENSQTSELLKLNSIDLYLNRCIRDSVIREIINGILESVDYLKPPEPAYGSLFLESEIFTAINPMCFYYPNLVIEFRKMYYDVVSQDSSMWNLSLNDLRKLLLQIKDPERRNKMLVEFGEMFKKCLKPPLRSYDGDYKHEMVYNVLCSFINHFEVESEHTKMACLTEEAHLTFGAINETKSLSQTSATSNNSRNRERNSQNINQKSVSNEDCQAYRESFFIRIHELLGDTIERLSANIESINRLKERDK